MEIEKYEGVKFPDHWVAVGYQLVDPMNGIAKGFWKCERIITQSALRRWLGQVPSGRFREYYTFYSAKGLVTSLQGNRSKDDRYVRAVVSLLDYLLTKKQGL